MIKVLPGKYFSSVDENKELNRYAKMNPPPERADLFESYIKEKFNAQYIREGGWPDIGYFLFDNERDAIMFILRFS